jgi:succinate dehydrogenase/fumarate reductase flavoprotein subunit
MIRIGEVGELDWDREVDVAVVGSGAAGLTAAIAAADGGATALVLEKADLLGGTSAFSGGMLWVPGNEPAAAAGVEDSDDHALTYIRRLTNGREPDPRLVETYVAKAREAVAFLERATPVKFHWTRAFTDYYQDLDGACVGRSIEPEPYAARDELGEWFGRIRESPHLPALMLDEIAGEGAAADPKNANAVAAGAAALASHLPTRMAEREANGIRCLGAALVSCLVRAALDLGVTLETGAPAREVVVCDGAVVGLVASVDGVETLVRARYGVVLSAGGFEWNQELVKAFIGVPELKPISPPTNVGDGLVMGIEAGASMANMNSTWAIPVVADHDFEFEGTPMALQDTPRMEAGVILVNRRGERFTNEAVCYMDMPRSHRVYDPLTQSWPNEPPVWAIFDQRVRSRIAIYDLKPDGPTPDWVFEESTLEGLAERIGVPRDALLRQVETFNANTEAGSDPEFGRGTVWYEGLTSGGPDATRALATLAEPPFFALRIYEGTIGTNGGLRIDENGQVQALRGGAIPGLYAAGNTAASACGPAYPGGGITLGQAVTFGYLGGMHLRERAAQRSHAALS